MKTLNDLDEETQEREARLRAAAPEMYGMLESAIMTLYEAEYDYEARELSRRLRMIVGDGDEYEDEEEEDEDE